MTTISDGLRSPSYITCVCRSSPAGGSFLFRRFQQHRPQSAAAAIALVSVVGIGRFAATGGEVPREGA